MFRSSNTIIPISIALSVAVIYIFYRTFYGAQDSQGDVCDKTPCEKEQDHSTNPKIDVLLQELSLVIQPKLFTELVAFTDQFGVVHEESLSSDSKKVIHDNLLWQNIYIKYRQDVWNDHAQDRQSESFDAFYYDPLISDLVNGATQSATNQENDQPQDSD